ncbi:phosphatidylglycerophosphatase A [Tepidimonas taiwanensis]|uniref:Phosphatidylglycerophosphatase A n=1 Tax=Tepidimonas taiwanensis TaxID=307486 RepID=A0A554X151_9BURK|nr:phosphatidylglycerophosphatase A [Tepidimonas taiwanensis]MCX7693025.1 phosphatidylglycerophosphatase A [Tepidimonas taiwanensis]MDM7462568.1 phosphatidylglycerophosphatase A [Tepidimonas taiwanensis]TSE29543.1 Phosphatidylglycerophosphatase A [Tepidimonas taiwanensis]UBQ05136.1 phosphatidylglycerophosphatase A [Tepidimonas taiwanensis]
MTPRTDRTDTVEPAWPLPGGVPTARFLFARLSHLIALGFGAGLSRIAPGTVGTLWAWAAFVVIDAWATPGDRGWALIIGATLLVGWWASTATARRTGIADPSFVVIDEVVAFWLVLWIAAPDGLLGQAVCFALFRFFDAAKPGPVAWADRVFKGSGWRGGWGVMFDDLVAAFCTLLVIALWRFAFGP